MALNCGIVGLPNVGKSTIFSAVTSAPAEAANYPFCTIDPNIGIVSVPDKRLDEISRLIPSKKVTPATVEFVDIAGLVKGASQGEGLGNRFLASIREVGVIAHVVRCFENPDIIHVSNKIAYMIILDKKRKHSNLIIDNIISVISDVINYFLYKIFIIAAFQNVFKVPPCTFFT